MNSYKSSSSSPFHFQHLKCIIFVYIIQISIQISNISSQTYFTYKMFFRQKETEFKKYNKLCA